MSRKKDALRHMSSHNKPVTYSRTINTTLNAEVHYGDMPRLRAFMDAELAFYNRLIEVFGSQFSRDYEELLNIDEKTVELFGQLCLTPFDIYNMTDSTKLPEYLNKHKETINACSKKIRFLLNNAVTNSPIAPEMRRRMGVSILRFYITQAEIRQGNSINVMTDDIFDIQYKVAFNTLTPMTSFHKRHIQIDRKSCKVEVNHEEDVITIFTPYNQKPIIVKGADMYKSGWNYIIIRQDDKIPTSTSNWVIDFKKQKPDNYLFKFLDRLGRSGIFEMGKRLN